jgi:glycosyltransferase involved in cell wall biosynthesis
MTTVVHVAFPFAPVAPDAAGGAEQMVYLLDRALRARGHRSMIVACEGSRTSGRLFGVPVRGAPDDAEARARAWQETADAIRRALSAATVDIVHLHGLDWFHYVPAGVPCVVTLHLPLCWYPEHALLAPPPNTTLCCVSYAQARTAPQGACVGPVVPNGIDLRGFARQPRVNGGANGPVVCIARVCAEKGLDLALDAADRAGVPIALAGVVFAYAAHRRYFEERIRPRLDGVALRFVERPTPIEKRALLARARAVLVPSLAPETSSLVAMEAAAAGAPVIAFPSGALTDLVADGETGFLVRDVGEMACAIHRAQEIDPARCRARARAEFDVAACARRYEDVYASCIAAHASGHAGAVA